MPAKHKTTHSLATAKKIPKRDKNHRTRWHPFEAAEENDTYTVRKIDGVMWIKAQHTQHVS